ncbi:MAG: restriction endonuclease [Clostridia bacterium]|nr:restriction endonuclease [Clostridia bacterium]
MYEEIFIAILICIVLFLGICLCVTTSKLRKCKYDQRKINGRISDEKLNKTVNSLFRVSEELTKTKDDFSNTKEELARTKTNLSTVEEDLRKTKLLLSETNENLVKTTTKLSIAESELMQHKNNLSLLLQSNLTSMPWLAGMMADFVTYDLELEAKKLDWGKSKKRDEKVASIHEIRADATKRIEEAKVAVYQLEYIRTLFPGIDDIIATDYKDLHFDGNIPDHDPTLDYLSSEEWNKLSDDEKSQLALDRYIESNKTKWQIGRDYELSVAYELSQKGYTVDTFGSYMSYDDLGRDLIVTKNQYTYIVQCKYWSNKKQIHENHIYQLYGTSVGYCIEKKASFDKTRAYLVTNIELSPMAKKVADYLGVKYVENHEISEFPRIKCNIGKDGARIYHLPIDNNYDTTKIDKEGEFYAFTVEEAVKAGFRRAFKWHGDK